MLLVVPGHDGRALHEFLRRRADRRPELLQRSDQLRIGGDETGAVARHRGPFAQGVEDGDVPELPHLEAGVGREVEPELRVRLVTGEQELVRARKLGEPLEKGEWRHRPRGVVGIVDPDDGRLFPGLRVDGLEVRQEAVRLQ